MGFEQGLGELEGDSRAAEVLAGVVAARLVGIENGEGGRKTSGRVGEVVIGDDQVDAQSGGGLGGGEGADSGIDADDQPGSGGDGCFDDLAFHAVALAEPVGDVEADVASAEEFYGGLEQDYGDGAVHVVVAVDKDGFAFGDGGPDPGDGGGHAGHGIRVEEMVEAGMEKATGLLSGGDAPGEEQLREERRDPDLPGQCLDCG